ncbi:MAG: YtxH domain-containing protein, partial [Rubrobacter sp.]|nr:YtxH domain-containing protein [Rubrobacter sp.]
TFLFGGAIGALAGILLAPRSGRELRGSIMDRAGEARERSRESYFQAQEQMQERLASARDGSRRSAEPEKEILVGPSEVSTSARSAPAETSRPPLRDVSWDARRELAGEYAEEPPENLRQRVRETRARLRARLDEPVRPDPEETREE